MNIRSNYDLDNPISVIKEQIEFRPIDYKDEKRQSKLRYMDFDMKTSSRYDSRMAG